MVTRKDVLLRAAYDLLKTADTQDHVEQATSIIVHYDSADCDGYCLMEDIADVLGLDDDSLPIPTNSKKWDIAQSMGESLGIETPTNTED